MMHKPFRLLWCILACCLFLTCTAIQGYAANLTLRMGLEQNPPLAGVAADGKPEGLFVDLMNEIARLEGWQIDYIPCPQASCLEMLSNHQIDLMAPLAWLPERAEHYVFSADDVVTNWGVVYSRPDAHIHSFLELHQRRIGVVPNNVQTIYLRNHLDEFGINVTLVNYPTFDAVFRALDEGEVDVAVVGRLFAMRRASAYRVQATPIIFNPIRVHFAFAQQTDPQVVATVNRHLELFKAQPNSLYFRSLNHWLHPQDSFSIPFWLKVLFATLLLSSVLLVGFTLLLRRSVERKTSMLRATEAILREKNAFLETLFQSIPFDLWVRDRNSRLLMQNDLNAAHYQVTIGNTPQEDGVPPALNRLWQVYLEQALQGESFDMEIREGERVYRKIVAPIRTDGTTVATFGLNIDITDSIQALEALHASERRFKVIFDESPIAIALVTLDSGVYVDMNRQFCELSGLSREQILGKNSLELGLLDSREEHERLQALLVARGRIDCAEIKFRAAERELRTGLLSVRVVMIARQPHAVYLIQDITELKQFKAQLQATEATFRSIFDNAPIGIFQSTSDGRLTSINNAFANIFGYSSPELMMREIRDITTQLYADPDQRRRMIRQLQTTESLVLDDLEFLRSDGSHFFGTMYIRAIRENNDSEKLLFDGFVVDSTERRRTQEILLQHEKMLMIGGLAAGMAHEINNPLGIIAQDLQNLQRRLSPGLSANRQAAERLGLDLDTLQAYLTEREITGYLHSISEAVRRTSRIIDNMLQFSRQNSANHQLAPLHEVIDHALELAGGDYDLRKLYKFQELRIDRAYASDLPLVSLNVTEIEQVLINLVKNATQAMSDWPGERAISITTRRDGNYALLTLCDTGPGMSEETRLRVFEPFFTTKPVGSGTGLGLAVSHAIITKNHKGLISVTSSPGKGCCFMIRLPLTQDGNHA